MTDISTAQIGPVHRDDDIGKGLPWGCGIPFAVAVAIAVGLIIAAVTL